MYELTVSKNCPKSLTRIEAARYAKKERDRRLKTMLTFERLEMALWSLSDAAKEATSAFITLNKALSDEQKAIDFYGNSQLLLT